MLVLCAAYLNDRLQCLVDRHKLLNLLASTIDFLAGLASLSLACRLNCSTLKNIRLALVQDSAWYNAGLAMGIAVVAPHTQTLNHTLDAAAFKQFRAETTNG